MSGDGVDIGYSPDGLRAAAAAHDEAGAAAESLAGALAAIAVPAAALGSVPSVAGFVATAVGARDMQVAGARRERERRTNVTARVRSTADLGDHLLSLTTDVAQSPGTMPFGDGTGILGSPTGD